MSDLLLAKTSGCQVGNTWMIWLYFITWKYLKTLLGVPNSNESGSFGQFISESILTRSRTTWEFGPNVARRRLWIGLWVMMSAKTRIQTWMQKERSPYVPALWWVCPEHCLAFCNNACWDFSIVAQRRKKGLLKISIWTKNGTDSATNVHTLWKWPATCYTATWTVLLTLFISSDAWCPSDSLHNTMLIFPDSLYIFTHSVFQLEINAVCSIQSFFLLIISSEEVTQSIIHVGCWINMCQCLYAQVAAGWLFFFFPCRIKCNLHHRLFHAGVAQIQSKIDSTLRLCVFA